MSHWMWPVSQHRGSVWHGHVLLDYRPSSSQISLAICRNRSHGFCPQVRRRTDADLGHLVMAVLSSAERRWFYFASLSMLFLFLVIYETCCQSLLGGRTL